jgi:hypothetical protein
VCEVCGRSDGEDALPGGVVVATLARTIELGIPDWQRGEAITGHRPPCGLQNHGADRKGRHRSVAIDSIVARSERAEPIKLGGLMKTIAADVLVRRPVIKSLGQERGVGAVTRGAFGLAVRSAREHGAVRARLGRGGREDFSGAIPRLEGGAAIG